MTELILPPAQTKGAKIIADRSAGLQAAGASWLPIQQFMASAITEANKLSSDVEPVSIATSALNCAAVGLIPGPSLGHAYFIPYKKHGRKICQLVIGYKGFLDLAFRSNFLKNVYAEVIVSGDEFRAWVTAEGMQVEHDLTQRMLGNAPVPTRENIIGAYCVYSTRLGGNAVVPLTRDEINNRDAKRNVWISDYVPMVCKSAVRKASRFWQQTPQIALAARLDSLAEAGEEQPPINDEVIDVQFSLNDLPTEEDEASK